MGGCKNKVSEIERRGNMNQGTCLEMGLFRVVATGTPRGRIGCFRLSLVPARPQFLPVPWSGCATCLRGASTREAWGEALLHEGVASTRALFTASPQGTKRGTQ